MSVLPVVELVWSRAIEPPRTTLASPRGCDCRLKRTASTGQLRFLSTSWPLPRCHRSLFSLWKTQWPQWPRNSRNSRVPGFAFQIFSRYRNDMFDLWMKTWSRKSLLSRCLFDLGCPGRGGFQEEEGHACEGHLHRLRQATSPVTPKSKTTGT